MEELNKTPFSTIYDSFFARVTDDMYVYGGLTEDDTYRMLQDLLLNAIPRFEFPRFNIFDYEKGYLEEIPNEEDENAPSTFKWVGGAFNCTLSQEEIGILAMCMVVEWYIQQIATFDNSRLKFSGSDFKMASQANHMSKLQNAMEEFERQCIHMQRIYKRRRISAGGAASTLGSIMSIHASGYTEIEE